MNDPAPVAQPREIVTNKKDDSKLVQLHHTNKQILEIVSSEQNHSMSVQGQCTNFQDNTSKNSEAKNKLVTQYRRTNPKKHRELYLEVIESLLSILGRDKGPVITLMYFIDNGVSFAKDLQKNLSLDKRTAYDHIERLHNADLIFPLAKTDRPRRGGPRTILYGIPGYTDEEIDRAITRELQLSSKTWHIVDQVYQRTLTEITHEGLQWNKIVFIARKKGNTKSGLRWLEIAEQVARKHQNNGVEVWR